MRIRYLSVVKTTFFALANRIKVNIGLEFINKDILKIVAEIGKEKKAVIPILHAVQKKYNYLPETALRKVCEITDIDRLFSDSV